MRVWGSREFRVFEIILWSLGFEGWIEFEVIDMQRRKGLYRYRVWIYVYIIDIIYM